MDLVFDICYWMILINKIFGKGIGDRKDFIFEILLM